MPLTEAAIKAARPSEKPYKLSDGRGLVLYVDPSGGRWWRLRYRYGDREKQLSPDTYPDVKLKRARQKTDEARRQISDGVDPRAARQAQRAALGQTFESIAREFLEFKRKTLAATTFDNGHR